MSEPLKPCPFCGGSGVDVGFGHQYEAGAPVLIDGARVLRVYCNDCDARTQWWTEGDAKIEGYASAEKAATASWNLRAAP